MCSATRAWPPRFEVLFLGPELRHPNVDLELEVTAMKMQLIQPFINAIDAVLAETLGVPVTIADMSMEEEGYRKKGVAALITFKGEIEGRVILDMQPSAALKVAHTMAGEDLADPDQAVREAVREIANMVIGNAVTLLNDRGYSFKVFTPELLTEEQQAAVGAESEATLLSFSTEHGSIFMNISMRYYRRRSRERVPALVT
jgi:chemotaxis protein CheX